MREEDDSSVEQDVDDGHLLNTWVRVYLHGLIVLVVVCVLAYIGTLLVPLFEVVGDQRVAIVLSFLTVLFGPPLIGSLVLFGVFPLVGRKKSWRGLLGWDDRLISELSTAKSNAQIVILNWPSGEVRTMGVLTSEFSDPATGRRRGAVYVPTAPQTRLGYLRIVDLSDVEFTDWTFREWQLYQVSFGTVSPARFREDESPER